jgi:hypothetical protein
MKRALHIFATALFCAAAWLAPAAAQEKKLERIRVGGGSVATSQV